MGWRSKIECFFAGINEQRFRYLIVVSAIVHIILIFAYKTGLGIDGYIYQRVAGNIFNADSPLFCGAFEGAYWPPLFPFYLALFNSFLGGNQYLFFFINLAMVLAISLLSAGYLKNIFEKKAVYWGIFFFFNSMMIYRFVHYYKYEVLSGLFIALALYLILTGKKYSHLALAGISLGLAILANGRLIALLPALIIYFILSNKSNRERLIKIALITGLTGLTILPWSIRNYICFEKPVILSTNSGINIYMGFNPVANGGFVAQDKFVPPYDKIDRTDHITYTKAAWEYIRENPGHSLLLIFKKINKLWQIHYFDATFFYPFFYLGIFLLVRIGPPGSKNGLRLVQHTFLFFTLFHIFFIARFYYLLPIAPLLYVTATSTQSFLWKKYLSPAKKNNEVLTPDSGN